MKYSINKIKNAGKKIIKIANDEESLEVLSFWRSMHSEPLEVATNIVEVHGKKINTHILIAKRLKRTESIVNKLKRLEKKIQLSTMNDMAGCRAILQNLNEVNRLVGKLSRERKFKLFRNYINQPRDSGYRSIHMIGYFNNTTYNKKMPVELQIRTFIQHSWATAVEIVDLFTKDSIKTNQGSREWTNFFKKLSKIFHILDESFNKVNKKHSDIEEYFKQGYEIFLNDCIALNFYDEIVEINELFESMDIINKFSIFTESVKLSTNENKDKVLFHDGYLLLIIEKMDNGDFNLLSRGYPNNNAEEANIDYLAAEKDVIENKYYVTALISSNAINDIEKAYPNYFADSTKFIEYIYFIIAVKKHFPNKNNLLYRHLLENFTV